jgi:hypothetical protein
MARTYTLSRFFKGIGTSLLLVTSVVACAGLPGIGRQAGRKKRCFMMAARLLSAVRYPAAVDMKWGRKELTSSKA